MALLGFVTVQHIAFPSLRSARSLEPDGIALFASDDTGDASGGTVLITVRADSSEFLYVLQTFTVRVNNSTPNPGPVNVLIQPEWVADQSQFASPYDIQGSVLLKETPLTTWRMAMETAYPIVDMARTMPTGKIRGFQATTTTNLVLFQYRANELNALYSTVGTFYMYRREALTVPGFLEALLRPALIR